MSAIGVDPRVTGARRYAVDVERPGMLHAAFVRSSHPHARVVAVDVSDVPDGCVALTPEDVADLGLYGCQARDQRVLADARGSAAYRRRITAVEVRRAIEDLAARPGEAAGAQGHG